MGTGKWGFSQREQDVVDAAADLDPGDTSLRAQQLRETAEQITDLRESEAARHRS